MLYHHDQSLRTHGLAFCLLIIFPIVCYAAAVPNDVAIRSKGEVSVFNPVELEERFNKWVWGVGMSLIGVSAPFVGTACAATPITFGVPCIALLSTFGLGAIVAAIGAVVPGKKFLAIRSNLPDQPNTIWRENWLAEHLATGKPAIVKHHDCYGPQCLQSEYSLHTTKGGKVLHRVLTGPRRPNMGTNHVTPKLGKRDYEQGYGDYTPYGDGTDQEFFLDYLFEVSDDTAASDLVAGYDYDSYDAQWSFAGAVDTNLVNSNGQGYYCMNLGEPDYSAGIATEGYAGFFQGEMEQDPDNEDAYIQQCAGEGATGDYNTYEFDGK